MLTELLAGFMNGRNSVKYVHLPNIIIVDDIEVAQALRGKAPRDYVIIHSPEIVKGKGEKEELWGIEFQGYLIESHTIQNAMSKLYKTGANGHSIKESMRTLEARIEEAQASKASGMTLLEEAGRHLKSEGIGGDAEEIRRVISALYSQFEHREHFIREAIQNADGSLEDKKNNRIDVFIDEKERTVRIEDKGKGMSRTVINEVFFNLYRSLNEDLTYAAGKFGIGRVSFFGLGHEYVRVDSKPIEGKGGIVTVDASLMREEGFQPTNRTAGTAVEIKLSESSGISFEKVKAILLGDCRYIETPLFVHTNGETYQLNEPLDKATTARVRSFKEGNIEGFVTLTEGEGKLDLLDHRIRLHSIKTKGYSGAVNCSGLETTFSRDTILSDPVLEQVLQIVDMEALELQKAEPVAGKVGLEEALREYAAFLKGTLFNADGSVNEQWIKEHLKEFKDTRGLFYQEPPSLLKKIVTYPVLIPFATAKYLAGKGKGRGWIQLFRNEENSNIVLRWASVAAITGVIVGAGTSWLASGSETAKQTFYSALSINYFISAAILSDFISYSAKTKITNNAYDKIARNHHHESMLEKMVRFTKKHAPLMLAGAAAMLITAFTPVGGLIMEAMPDLPIPGISARGPEIIRGLTSRYIEADYLTQDELVKTLRSFKHDSTGYVKADTSNALEISRKIKWADRQPYDRLQITGSTAARLPPELAKLPRDISTADKIRAVSNYIDRHFEYNTISPEIGKKYPDMLAAIIAEQKGICSTANTAGAWMLHQMGVENIRAVTGTLNGAPHFWLEVDAPKGTYSVDYTPRLTSPSLEEALSNEPMVLEKAYYGVLTAAAASYPYLALVTAGGLAGMAASATISKRRKLRPDNSALTQEQQQTLKSVEIAMAEFPGTRVYFASGMNKGDLLFELRQGAVILNKARLDITPGVVKLAYVAHVIKDAKAADSFAKKMVN